MNSYRLEINMEVIQEILKFLDFQLDAAPEMYGAFHLSFFAASFVVAFILCLLWKLGVIKDVKRVVLITAIIVLVFEIYKQINLTFGYTDGITVHYQLSQFPFHFYTSFIIASLLCGLTHGKTSESFAAYLATYSLFGGIAGMIYPDTALSATLGLSIQSMLTYGSMIAIGIFVLFTGTAKTKRTTVLRALPVFIFVVGFAVSFNEAAFAIGLPEGEVFNMLSISSHFESDLPVYSLVHNALYLVEPPTGYIISVAIYILGFTIAAFALLQVPILIKYINEKDFDEDYAEEDAARAAEETKKEQDARDLEEAREKIKELESKLAEKEKPEDTAPKAEATEDEKPTDEVTE